MKISRELKVGFVFVAAIALFVWGFNFLKGKDIFKRETHYYCVYPSVTGLAASSPVYVNGLKVGVVKEIFFHPHGPGKVIVDFAVNPKLDIPQNSIVRIYNADLMGSKAIDLRLGNSTVMAQRGDTLAGEIQSTLQEEVNRQVLPLKTKAEALMSSIDSAMMVIRYVFNEKTRENLENSFASIKSTIENLESTSYNLDTLMKTEKGRLALIVRNIESISTNIKNNNQQIANIIQNFSNISDTLARIRISKTFDHINQTLNTTSGILDRVQRGEGSLGLLLNNDSLYNELSASSKELKLLLEDVRLNPHRYVQISVFGNNPKKNQYQPASK